jgi:hypothetical protein
MPPVKNVGEPCAGKSHARFDAAAGGNPASRLSRAAKAPPADPNATSAGWEVPVVAVKQDLRMSPLELALVDVSQFAD